MAVVAIDITEVARPYVGASVLETPVTLNNVDGHQFRPGGKEYVFFKCSVAGSVTIASSVDPYNRTGDIVIPLTAVAGDDEAVWGPAPSTGFAVPSTGFVNIKATGTITAVVFRKG